MSAISRTTTRNSGILVVGTVVGVLLLGGMAAYSLAKLDLPGSGLVMLYLLVGSSLPIQLFLVPLFFIWQRLGLVNNLFGLIDHLHRHQRAVRHLPASLLHGPAAARFRGRGAGRRRERVADLHPDRRAALLARISHGRSGRGASVWNEFLLATVFLTEQELFTVVTSYYNFTTRFSRDWALTSAAA